MPDRSGVKSHRCERLLKSNMFIRKDERHLTDYNGWWLWFVDLDEIWQPFGRVVTKISYCPFCGEYLRVEESFDTRKENKDD